MYLHQGAQVFSEINNRNNDRQLCRYPVEEYSGQSREKVKVLGRYDLAKCEEQKNMPIENNEGWGMS